jgi:hypothetical protein
VLTGAIPTELGNLSSLLELQFGENRAVPTEICAIFADPARMLDTSIADRPEPGSRTIGTIAIVKCKTDTRKNVLHGASLGDVKVVR